MKKRLISMIMAMCICITSIGLSAKAEENEYQGVITALRIMEPFKEDFGLANIDFSLIEIGNEIKVYNYEDENFVESMTAVPLFYEDELISILYNVGNGHYQPMPEMHTLIDALGCTNIAIVYDRMGCNVYDGISFSRILQAERENESRDVLTNDVLVLPNSIELASLSECYELGYMPNRSRSLAEYVYLPVAHVSVDGHDMLCWAATIACIANYKNGSNYDAEYIARAAFNGELRNQKKPIYESINELKKYCPQYNYIDYLPSTDRIKTNLRNNNPVYGSFDGWGNRHAAVIYGFNESESYYIHDPLHGSMIGYLVLDVVTYYIPADNGAINLYQGCVVN